MKRILRRFAAVVPSGNITAVIFDELAVGENKLQLNSAILATWKAKHPQWSEIEQCCIVTKPKDPRAIARVEMLGGEFCGNATRSVIWLLVEGRDEEGLIEVSGVNNVLQFQVKNGDVTLEMPLLKHSRLIKLIPEGTLVQLEGITQLVVTDPTKQALQSPRALLLELLKEDKFNLAALACVGVSYYNQATSKAEFCVRVNAVKTTFDETACGSGTCAIGIALATQQQRSVLLSVVQPSGKMITTRVIYGENGVKKSLITGKVEILYDGEFII